MLKVFVDTEFTNFIDTELISIGLAAATGEEFYAEVPYPDATCSPFVREVVIPLLGKDALARCEVDELPGRLLNWLNLIKPRNDEIEICFDYQTDWSLFEDVLYDRMPDWCRPKMVAQNINELLRYEFHKKNNFPEHHALYDAMANRYAFRERVAVSN